MRVIAGNFKGRKIDAVKGDTTRPTADKIKETVFNVIGQFFEGGTALDLFAGSGNLGIEALSRGMDLAIFIDANFEAVKTIKRNLSKLDLQKQTEVYRNDAFKALKILALKGKKFDLIFLDPPYALTSITKLLTIIIESDLLTNDAMIVCEYGTLESVQFDGLKLNEIKKEKYGTVAIQIFQKI